jgi:hypothetical protein
MPNITFILKLIIVCPLSNVYGAATSGRWIKALLKALSDARQDGQSIAIYSSFVPDRATWRLVRAFSNAQVAAT